MKILFFNFSNGVYEYALGEAGGGAERQQWLLAHALTAVGCSVIVGVQGIPRLQNGKTMDGVRFVSLPPSDGPVAPYQRLSSLYHLLRAERPDWCYWRCAGHLWGPAVMIARNVGVRTIFAAGFDTDVQPRHALSQRPGCWPLFSWGLSQCDRIFVQHHGQFAALASPLRYKASIVPNLTHLPASIKPHLQRQKYIAWVGMLRQPKRPDLLVEIAKEAQNLRFVVCGGPSDHRSPKDYGTEIIAALSALPNVDYRGQVSPAAADDVIANASALLCTSDGEGFPNIFLEAWASGTPVVSLKIDPDDVMMRNEIGLVSRDIQTTISNLTSLINQPQRREEMAVRSRSYVTEAHSEPAVVSRFQRALEDRPEATRAVTIPPA